MPTVLHVDDRYRNKPASFKTLREFLEARDFTFIAEGDFQKASRVYQASHFPEVVIMDILDVDADGQYSSPGTAIAEFLDETFASGPEAPCIIFYTGIIDDNHHAIKAIREYNFALPIIRKTALPLKDAEMLFKEFPQSLQHPKV
jgi:CheY-like chemotaxis protein